MEFPKIKDIASKEVVKVFATATLTEAVKKMHSSNHRDLVVVDSKNSCYGVLRVNDLIKYKAQNIDFDTKINDVEYERVATIYEDQPVIQAMELIDKKTNCLCVIDAKNTLSGFITYFDILSTIDPKTVLEKQTISDVMLNTLLKFAHLEDNTLDVIQQMDDDIDDSVILLDEKQRAKGIITTKDIITLFGEDKDLSAAVKNYMSSPIETIKSYTTVSQALSFIKQKHFKRLIIEDDNGTILGQITQEELIVKVYSRWAEQLKSSASELQEINRVLQAKANKYETLAVTDRLTGIYNRVKFEQELKVEIDKIQRYKIEPFSLVLFDIDNFKSINDSYGHLEGDRVLKKITRIVTASLRSSDIFARWGGEEFVVLLTFTSLQNAVQAANILKETINETYIDNKVEHVTCSFGVTSYQKGDTIHSVLKRADEAMYIAKKSGKNRVEAKEI